MQVACLAGPDRWQFLLSRKLLVGVLVTHLISATTTPQSKESDRYAATRLQSKLRKHATHILSKKPRLHLRSKELKSSMFPVFLLNGAEVETVNAGPT